MGISQRACYSSHLAIKNIRLPEELSEVNETKQRQEAKGMRKTLAIYT